MWKKAIIIPYILLMFGSGGVLLADGATYGMLGHWFLGLGGYVIFGSVFLVTFGIYKLADRLPRSTRKAMKEASKRRRLGQMNSQPSALHPSYAPQKSVTGPQFCTACGRALQEGTAFCTNCGSPDNRMQNS